MFSVSSAPTWPASSGGLQRLEVGVEAAVEADQQPGRRQLRRGGAGAGEIEVDRLLAEDRLAGGRGGQAVVEVGVGGAGDDRRRRPPDRPAPPRRSTTAAPSRAASASAAVGDGVDHVLQPQRRVRGGVGGVDLADAAGAEEGDEARGHQTSASRTGAPLATERAAASASASARDAGRIAGDRLGLAGQDGGEVVHLGGVGGWRSASGSRGRSAPRARRPRSRSRSSRGADWRPRPRPPSRRPRRAGRSRSRCGGCC